MGYKAAVHVYTVADQNLYATFTLHKVSNSLRFWVKEISPYELLVSNIANYVQVKIEALAFSCDSKLLYSLGGQDDGSVVVWDLETRQSICGNPVAPQTAGAITVLKVKLVSMKISFKNFRPPTAIHAALSPLVKNLSEFGG